VLDSQPRQLKATQRQRRGLVLLAGSQAGLSRRRASPPPGWGKSSAQPAARCQPAAFFSPASSLFSPSQEVGSWVGKPYDQDYDHSWSAETWWVDREWPRFSLGPRALVHPKALWEESSWCSGIRLGSHSRVVTLQGIFFALEVIPANGRGSENLKKRRVKGDGIPRPTAPPCPWSRGPRAAAAAAAGLDGGAGPPSPAAAPHGRGCRPPRPPVRAPRSVVTHSRDPQPTNDRQNWL